MIYSKDNTGKLRAFTTDCDETDLNDISTFDKVVNTKYLAQKEADLILVGAVLKVVDGGKE